MLWVDPNNQLAVAIAKDIKQFPIEAVAATTEYNNALVQFSLNNSAAIASIANRQRSENNKSSIVDAARMVLFSGLLRPPRA